jgi:predicted ester cyclase
VPNADTLHRIFALMDEQDFASIQELLVPEFSAVFGDAPLGVEEWFGMTAMMYAAFDGTHAIDETFEVDDHVFLRGRFIGTHTGDFMGVPATGKPVTISFMNFDRFADGKLAEHRAQADMLGLMQQLGAIPATASA